MKHYIRPNGSCFSQGKLEAFLMRHELSGAVYAVACNRRHRGICRFCFVCIAGHWMAHHAARIASAASTVQAELGVAVPTS